MDLKLYSLKVTSVSNLFVPSCSQYISSLEFQKKKKIATKLKFDIII